MTRHLITSALPYINGVKHLGNMIGSMLPADVYARFLRMQKQEVLFICATDEHGTPAELAALAAGLPVAEFCAQQHDVQEDLARRWGLSFDHFGRSSSPQNAELTRHFARKLRENGYIEERVTTQAFSITDNRFLPDRYVTGICPHCNYGAARGDQCENCTRVLDPTDLIEPRSVISGSTDIEFRDSTHLFLLLPKLADEVRKWVDTKTDWPLLTKSIAMKWLDEGLDDRGITRDLEWGVAIPEEWEGFEGKVFYVWFDAPIEYIGATKEWSDMDPENRNYRDWWYEADDVIYSEFMAKDNVPFHTIVFPASQLGTREPWKMVDNLKAFNWLTYYGGKFSTSQQRGVFMHDALDILPADTWRYMLLSNAPETSDSDFNWELLATAVNKDLAGTLGNFVNRVLKFTENNFGTTIPEGGTPGEHEQQLITDLNASLERLTQHFTEQQFRKAMNEMRAIWSLGNVYLDSVAPWKTVKTDKEQTALQVRTAIGLISVFAAIASPAMPDIAKRIAEAVGNHEPLTWPGKDVSDIVLGATPGASFTVPPLLFERIEDETLQVWKDRFGAEA